MQLKSLLQHSSSVSSGRTCSAVVDSCFVGRSITDPSLTGSEGLFAMMTIVPAISSILRINAQGPLPSKYLLKVFSRALPSMEKRRPIVRPMPTTEEEVINELDSVNTV